MLNRKTALLLLSFLSFSAQADWVGSIEAKRFTLKNTGQNLHLNSATATLGYEFEVAENIKLIPQFSYGIGFGDDSLSGANPATNTTRYELDKVLEASLRAEYQFTDKLYGFAAIVRNRIELNTITNQNTFNSSITDWGGAIGVGYQLDDRSSIELAFHSISSTDVVSLGYRYRF